MSISYLNDLDVKNKIVLVRADLNVPLQGGAITSDVRIQSELPTIKLLLERGAGVIIMSHLGRPDEGEVDDRYTLKTVAKRLSKLLNQTVELKQDWLDGVAINPGEVVLCENVRFNKGEKANDETLAKRMASLADVFVMDAFASAHRAHASTCAVAKHAKISCAGPLLQKEIEALSKAMHAPKKPIVAIVGGSKVSTKLQVLEHLIEKVDGLILGGGIANTFLLASGFKVGKSLAEPEMVPQAKQLMEKAKGLNVKIPMLIDAVVAHEVSESAEAQTKPMTDIADNDLILDIGTQTAQQFCELIQSAQTIIWNGPVGVFEIDNFSAGTEKIANAIASSNAFSLAGGGDTIAAIEKFGISSHISYISTGGGAFLEFLEGKELPGIVILDK